MDVVTPPKIQSRRRECPYAPRTRRSAAVSITWRRSTSAVVRPSAVACRPSPWLRGVQDRPRVSPWLLAMAQKVRFRVYDRYRDLVRRPQHLQGFADRTGGLQAGVPSDQYATRTEAGLGVTVTGSSRTGLAEEKSAPSSALALSSGAEARSGPMTVRSQ